jgi:hypothetical protein
VLGSDAQEGVRLCTWKTYPKCQCDDYFQPQGAVSKGADRKHTDQPVRGQNAGPVTMRMGEWFSEARQASHSWQRRTWRTLALDGEADAGALEWRVGMGGYGEAVLAPGNKRQPASG